jgi:hypothetical protein
MTEASLAIARKVVLCVGLLTGALLFLYPHWIGTFRALESRAYAYDLGRAFVTAPPMPDPAQAMRLLGFNPDAPDTVPFLVGHDMGASYRVHRVRQLTEVALAVLFTFGLVRALRKPAGD